MSSTLEASIFMRKNYLDNLHSIKNTGKNLTLKKMFEICEQLMLEQSDEFYGVINWEDSPWKHLSLFGDEQVISLLREGLRIFIFCVLLWKDERKPTIKYCLGRKVELVQKFIRIQNFGHN